MTKETNAIKVKANQYILDITTGNLFFSPTQKEMRNPDTGKMEMAVVNFPMTLGDILARPVAEGLGIDAERKFTCSMLGGKLFDHMSLESDEGSFDVTSEHLTLIKKVVDELKFQSNDGKSEKNMSWLKASLMFLLDQNSISDKDERDFFIQRYSSIDEKIKEWKKIEKSIL